MRQPRLAKTFIIQNIIICDNRKLYYLPFNGNPMALTIKSFIDLMKSLPDANRDYGCFLFDAPTSVEFESSFVLTAYIGFVDLDDTLEFRQFPIVEIVSYSAEEKPCCLLCYSEVFGKLPAL